MAQALSPAELYGYAKQLGVPLDVLQKTAKIGRLPVVNFAAGGLGMLVICFVLFFVYLFVFFSSLLY